MSSVDVPKPRVSFPASVRNCLIVGLVVFLACLFGIMTRPVGFLAAFWPANAILLALFIRFPHLASTAGWLFATIGYLAADFATGGQLLKTFWLTAANLVGVAAGFIAAQNLSEEDRALERPRSMIYMFGICIVAAMAAAVVGGAASTVVFGHSFMDGVAFWFTTEFVNAAVIVPIIITFPGFSKLAQQARTELSLRSVMPSLLVALSMIFGQIVGGPGLIAFPVPALMLCALSYSLFTTALITMFVCSWQLIVIIGGFVPFPLGNDLFGASSISVRLGIALAALGPLTAATINAERNRLLAKLDRAASYDHLTGALSRSAFLAKAGDLMSRMERTGRPVAVLMLDIDHFKAINDSNGHAAGDATLAAFADIVRSHIRERDVFGRVGGEEFAIVMADITPRNAYVMAERIRDAVAGQPVEIGSTCVNFTVSIGISSEGYDLPTMLSAADEALYRAKHTGRNRALSA